MLNVTIEAIPEKLIEMTNPFEKADIQKTIMINNNRRIIIIIITSEKINYVKKQHN